LSRTPDDDDSGFSEDEDVDEPATTATNDKRKANGITRDPFDSVRVDDGIDEGARHFPS
jgi:hypothetical protein